MSNFPLPELAPGDSEDRLLTDARQRIAMALLEFDRLRKQVRSEVELRDMNSADIEATRVVVLAETVEYGKLALTGSLSPHYRLRSI